MPKKQSKKINGIKDDPVFTSARERKALKALQVNIQRMSGKSDIMKWSFIATMLAMAYVMRIFGETSSTGYITYATCAVITLILWYNDARYLRVERQLCKHSEAILNHSIPQDQLFDFNPNKYKADNILKIMCCSFSTSFYWIFIVLSAAFVLNGID